MAFVVNNIVKMEWEKKHFLTTKNGSLIVAVKEYTNKDGKVIPVCFDEAYVWVWGEVDDIWTTSEFLTFVKDNVDVAFPTQYAEFIPIYSTGEELDIKDLEKFGLEEFAEDIKNRLEDLAPYGVEKPANIG